MPPKSASELEAEAPDNESEFVEVDPSGRYGRYEEVLGKGAFKKVYRAFDELEGIEVAWNQVKITDLMRNSVDLERLHSEVHLLKTLKHKNIIKFYKSWVDIKNDNINFITEIFTSGNLREYRKKHKHVDVRALKKWSRQILEGLLYLHSHDPPVIHRDVKCDNIFVNGNQGEVKIGDLGLAAILQQAHSAHSVIGTPEFMAPELYEEEYNELVDIYAFGMCLLELVTLEYPYVECANAAQIYRKVTAGIKPASLGKVKDPEVCAFIEKCIANASDRLSAKELLMDPFLRSGKEHVNVQSHSTNASSPYDFMLKGSRDFMVQGQRKDHRTIFLKLRIEDSPGQVRNIHFPFDIEEDNLTDVAREMGEELDLPDQDISVIAALIDSEIQFHIPGWIPREPLQNNSFRGQGDDITPKSGPSILGLLPSGRKYWSDSPKNSRENSPLRLGPPSNMLPVESISSGDFWSDKNVQSPINHNQESVSDIQVSPFGDFEIRTLTLEQNATASEMDLDGIRSIVERVENVLDEQMKETDELRKKHRLAVLDILNEVPQEARQIVVNICDQKMSEHKFSHEGGQVTNTLPDQSSSKIGRESRKTVSSYRKKRTCACF